MSTSTFTVPRFGEFMAGYMPYRAPRPARKPKALDEGTYRLRQARPRNGKAQFPPAETGIRQRRRRAFLEATTGIEPVQPSSRFDSGFLLDPIFGGPAWAELS